MRFLTAVLGGVLGAGILFMAGATGARADSPVNPAPDSAAVDEPSPVSTQPVTDAQPGTRAEEQAYAQRETESPQVQEFAGGEVIIGVSIGLIILIVLLIILLD